MARHVDGVGQRCNEHFGDAHRGNHTDSSYKYTCHRSPSYQCKRTGQAADQQIEDPVLDSVSVEKRAFGVAPEGKAMALAKRGQAHATIEVAHRRTLATPLADGTIESEIGRSGMG